MKVYGLSEGQCLDRRIGMAQAAVEAHINPAFQTLARGHSINLHSAEAEVIIDFSALNNNSAISFVS